MNVNQRIGHCVTTVVALTCLLGALPARAADRLYCFSDVCLSDLPAVLINIPLKSLSGIAEARPPTVDLKRALPGVAEDDRRILAKRVAADGRFLVDAQTLRIFLGVTAICAPTAPFAAMFASSSGYSTAVEFDVVKAGEGVQFGVKTIARDFTLAPGTSEYAALVVDLSRKFGFRIDNPFPTQLAGGIVSAYKPGEHGFQLSFYLQDMPNRDAAIFAQSACEPSDRAKID